MRSITQTIIIEETSVHFFGEDRLTLGYWCTSEVIENDVMMLLSQENKWARNGTKGILTIFAKLNMKIFHS